MSETHLSQQQLAELWRLTGCVFEEQADRLDQQGQDDLDGVCEGQVREQNTEGGHQG